MPSDMDMVGFKKDIHGVRFTRAANAIAAVVARRQLEIGNRSIRRSCAAIAADNGAPHACVRSSAVKMASVPSPISLSTSPPCS